MHSVQRFNSTNPISNSLIRQWRRRIDAGGGLAVINFDGALLERLLDGFGGARAKATLYFSCGDPDYVLPLDLTTPSDVLPRWAAARDCAMLLSDIEPNLLDAGEVRELGVLIEAIVASDVPTSLALPPRLIDDAAFRRQVRATVLDRRLEAALEAPNSEGLRRNLLTLLTPIFRDPEWLGMLWPSGARPSFDPGGVHRNGALLFADLSELGVDTRKGRFIAAALALKVARAAHGSSDAPLIIAEGQGAAQPLMMQRRPGSLKTREVLKTWSLCCRYGRRRFFVEQALCAELRPSPRAARLYADWFGPEGFCFATPALLGRLCASSSMRIAEIAAIR